MNIKIEPSSLSGSIEAISSKSHLHRHLLCAALSEKETLLRGCCFSEDIRSTMACIKALGADCEENGDQILVKPVKRKDTVPVLNCRESGSTLRFLLPVAAALYEESLFLGEGRLPERPIGALVDCLSQHGAGFDRKEGLPLRVFGKLESGIYRLPGNISSQYITGLLLALPLLPAGGGIHLDTALSSKGYVDMSIRVQQAYGIGIESVENGYCIKGEQRYQSPGQVKIEGDWSNAAFFLAAGAIGGAGIRLSNLSLDSAQGDKAILELLRRFGAEVRIEQTSIQVRPGPLKGIEIDAEQIPDLVPILAVVAAYASGETRIRGAARLRLKESDRIASVLSMLKSLGADAEEVPDGLLIRGGRELTGGIVDSFHDHRIAMSAAILALGASGPVEILDAGSVSKSYPAFYMEYNKLGGKANVPVCG